MYTRVTRDDIFFFKILGVSFLVHGIAYLVLVV